MGILTIGLVPACLGSNRAISEVILSESVALYKKSDYEHWVKSGRLYVRYETRLPRANNESVLCPPISLAVMSIVEAEYQINGLALHFESHMGEQCRIPIGNKNIVHIENDPATRTIRLKSAWDVAGMGFEQWGLCFTQVARLVEHIAVIVDEIDRMFFSTLKGEDLADRQTVLNRLRIMEKIMHPIWCFNSYKSPK